MTTGYNPGQTVTLTGVIKSPPPASALTDPTAAALLVMWPNQTTIKTYLSSTGWASQGNWNAATNTPALADGTGTVGHYYTVSVAGTVDFGDETITFAAGEYVYYDGDYWRKLTGIQSDNLAHPSVGTFSYDFPIPDSPGSFTYTLLCCGVIKAAATPEVFRVRTFPIF